VDFLLHCDRNVHILHSWGLRPLQLSRLSPIEVPGLA
jgi:hypothetical protein